MSYYAASTGAIQGHRGRRCDIAAGYRDSYVPPSHPPEHSMLFLPVAANAGARGALSPRPVPSPLSLPHLPLVYPTTSRNQEYISAHAQRVSDSRAIALGTPYTPPAPLNAAAPLFRAPVPLGYNICERARVAFTSRNSPGVLVSECIATNYQNIDNGDMLVKCFVPYRSIPWALIWPGYSSEETRVISMRGSGPVTLRELACYICKALSNLQRQRQSSNSSAAEMTWALGGGRVQLDQIWLVAFGLSDDEDHLWVPEFEISTPRLPYTT